MMKRTELEAKNATTFDEWADRGRGVRMGEGHAHLVSAALDRIQVGEGEALLDIGCGVGMALEAAAARGAGPLYGVDVSEQMVARCRARLPGAVIQQASGEALGLPDECVHHVISIESLYYHHDPCETLAEAVRVLKPGGWFCTVIEFFHENPGTHGWPDAVGVPMHCWSTDRWEAVLESAGLVYVASDRVIHPDVPREETFTPSSTFATFEAYASYRREGGLLLVGRKL